MLYADRIVHSIVTMLFLKEKIVTCMIMDNHSIHIANVFLNR